MRIQPELVFAYGSLKESSRLRSMLKDISRWRIIGTGTVQGRLYDTGPYPAFGMSDDSADRVPGILVKLESGAAALARLDEFEDVDAGLYARQCLPVRLDDETTHDAWVYVYCRALTGLERINEW